MNVGSHTLGRLRELGEVAARVDPIRADFSRGSGVQDGVQFTAMNRDLRPSIPSGDAAGLIPDRLAALGEVCERRGCQTIGSKVGRQSEGIELANRMR